MILSSIFTTQPHKITTVRIRKANLLLFQVLIKKFTFEHIMRYAESRNRIWVNQLKNMQKILKRRLNKNKKNNNINKHDDDNVEIKPFSEFKINKNDSDNDDEDEEDEDYNQIDANNDKNKTTIFIK